MPLIFSEPFAGFYVPSYVPMTSRYTTQLQEFLLALHEHNFEACTQ